MILEVMRCDYCKRELAPGGHNEADRLSLHCEAADLWYHLHFCPVGCRLLWQDEHSYSELGLRPR